MCGIISAVSKNAQEISDTTCQHMLETLGKRGPDDRQFTRISSTKIPAIGCTLGQTRLSILDIEGGKQPMRDNTLPLTVVFNGEIYNYKELRTELEKAGHRFSTKSDTEAILKAYAEWGKDAPKHLDGMFAFALWDERADSLFLARDRFGKKPLYYAWEGPEKTGTFMLASEIKALFASGKIKGKIDPQALDTYLSLMYIPADRSVYSNIHQLPPAHAATYNPNSGLTTWQYWTLEYRPNTDSYDTAKARIKELFSESVRKRMVADVEIGSLLSGGVDSTLVTAYAQKYANKPLKTFSVGYGTHIDELPYAKQASEKIGTDHYTLQASGDLVDELKKVIAYFDEPHADSSNFPQHLVSQLAATKVKVALSGDGADELFMGYGWYWKHMHLPFAERWTKRIFSNPFKEHLKRIEVFSQKERRQLWKKEVVSGAGAPSAPLDLAAALSRIRTLNPLTKINLWDLSVYLPGQLLAKVDRTSMMHSLEVRSPFLDTALAEYVFNLPIAFKCDPKKGVGKLILKDILSELMPADFVHRRKQGFGAPVKEWLKTKPYETLVKEKLLSPNAHLTQYLQADEVSRLVNVFYSGDTSVYYKIWTLLCLEIWLETHHEFLS